MSLFDVLRYPVSIPPTLEEFQRIPKDLFNKWAQSANWTAWVPGTHDREGMVVFYTGIFDSHDRTEKNLRHYRDEIESLRQMIKEYGNDCV
jgi:hypothetical protein